MTVNLPLGVSAVICGSLHFLLPLLDIVENARPLKLVPLVSLGRVGLRVVESLLSLVL